jgi:hypothetical protein
MRGGVGMQQTGNLKWLARTAGREVPLADHYCIPTTEMGSRKLPLFHFVETQRWHAVMPWSVSERVRTQ